MSRFNSPEEVKAWALKAAADDYRRHIDFGIDLNPFSTASARDDWQRGYDNLGCRSYESSIDYDTIYQRGFAARIVKEAKEKSQ